MKDLSLFNKKLFVSYIAICIVTVCLLLTGYSFSITFLNYTLLAIVVIFPIAALLKSTIRVWLKLLIGSAVVVILFFIVSSTLTMVAFHSGSERRIQEWKVGHYKIILAKRQDYVGAPYERFELVQYRLGGLIRKTMAFGFPEQAAPDPCKIQFKKDNYDNKQAYEFDSCMKTIKKNY